MTMIVLPDEELKKLEKRLGPVVRRIGSWNTDGVFGYAAVPISIVEQAATGAGDPSLSEALAALRHIPDPERTERFVELLHSSGPAFIREIATASRRPNAIRASGAAGRA